MNFQNTAIEGARLVGLQPRSDARGSFARAWCSEEFAAEGIEGAFVQANVAHTHASGTLRGLHYQAEPHAEAKLVRCTRGAIFDVIADVRAGSPTFGKWIGVELTPDGDEMLYVPPGCAHGYQTLTDDTEVFYLVSCPYVPSAERGLRYDDALFGIVWPAPVREISEKDMQWPDFQP